MRPLNFSLMMKVWKNHAVNCWTNTTLELVGCDYHAFHVHPLFFSIFGTKALHWLFFRSLSPPQAQKHRASPIQKKRTEWWLGGNGTHDPTSGPIIMKTFSVNHEVNPSLVLVGCNYNAFHIYHFYENENTFFVLSCSRLLFGHWKMTTASPLQSNGRPRLTLGLSFDDFLLSKLDFY